MWITLVSSSEAVPLDSVILDARLRARSCASEAKGSVGSGEGYRSKFCEDKTSSMGGGGFRLIWWGGWADKVEGIVCVMADGDLEG
jgi:hypothetical protein